MAVYKRASPQMKSVFFIFLCVLRYDNVIAQHKSRFYGLVQEGFHNVVSDDMYKQAETREVISVCRWSKLRLWIHVFRLYRFTLMI